MCKTHDGRQSKENLRSQEDSKVMNIRQSSTQDLIASLKRAANKRLTSRGTKRAPGLNQNRESHKYIKNYHNISASHNKFVNNPNLSNVSPKKKSKKSLDKNYANERIRYISKEILKDREDNYNADSQVDWKTNHSSSRGRKRLAQLNANSKVPYQASLWNSNTSRKTPVNNTKFGNTKNRVSK